jgi:hypothetical protein
MPVGGERCPWATTASTDEAIGRITPAKRSASDLPWVRSLTVKGCRVDLEEREYYAALDLSSLGIALGSA